MSPIRAADPLTTAIFESIRYRVIAHVGGSRVPYLVVLTGLNAQPAPTSLGRSLRAAQAWVAAAMAASTSASWSVGLNWISSVPSSASGACPGAM